MDFGAGDPYAGRPVANEARFLNNGLRLAEMSSEAVPVRGRRIEMGLLMLRVVAGLAVLAVSERARRIAADRPGLVKEKPAPKPYVETPEGFMVLYAQKIPGTDATFQMILVPGGKVPARGARRRKPGTSRTEARRWRSPFRPFWMGSGMRRPGRNTGLFMEMFMVFKSFEGRGIRKVTGREQGRRHHGADRVVRADLHVRVRRRSAAPRRQQ